MIWSRRSSEVRRSWWCEGEGRGRSLFIEGRWCRGCRKVSSTAWPLRRSKGQGEDGTRLATAWRGSGYRESVLGATGQLGRLMIVRQYPRHGVDGGDGDRSSGDARPMIKELLRIGAQFVGYRDYANKTEEKLIEANERADTLALKLEQCEEARKKAESNAVEARQEANKAKADAAGVEDLRKRLHDAETSLSDHITAQSSREAAITKRIKTQSRRFVDRTSQEFELEDPDNDALLDAVSFLEFHGTEAREGIDEAKAGLLRLFPYFFPKKEAPATFLNLAKCFNPPEDLGLKLRHENMKIAVESTVALVADSQQTIDWAKVGDTEQIEQAKWRSLIKAAKLNTKKILAYLGIKPSSTPSSSRPEV
ncbi:hypothetical protein QYE76_052611 [Lolium multiflorum]|uniref:FRIGIDA-like protein n=1 Tax=Lolium multiflorum TaxID=4521 RepID=A0AAD8SUE7_LOLMU|nr:hypothetical protein QYE76_052611 [Lolium multiflorum]